MDKHSRIILILYASADQRWLEPVKQQIHVLEGESEFVLEEWNEKQIRKRQKKKFPKEELLGQASLVILLLSDSFLESAFLQEKSIRQQLKDRQVSESPLILILLEKCKWKRFPWLKGLPLGTPKDFTHVLFDSFPISKEGLYYLHLEGLGPVKQLSFYPQVRLNLITGDNGLGKTFLLECCWWVLTGEWADIPAHPREDANKGEIKITYELSTEEKESKRKSVSYDLEKQMWPTPEDKEKSSGLAIYARVDGSYAIWDPVKRKLHSPQKDLRPLSPLVFREAEVWGGIQEGKDWFCNGLLRDWDRWQSTSPDSPFSVLEQILERLSPSHREKLKPGKPVRLPRNTLAIPTLEYPYGTVPILHAATSVKRFVMLAYLILWAWEEHKIVCADAHVEPQKKIIILIDEVEAHLHPKWTRSIVSSLLEIPSLLDPALKGQFFISSHSPLITASVEPFFEEKQDRLFHLNIEEEKIPDSSVSLDNVPFIGRGRVDSWLTSGIFDLKQARSIEAEKAIEEAKSLQQLKKPNQEKVREVHDRLARYLGGDHDIFWPRWLYFAEKHGVKL